MEKFKLAVEKNQIQQSQKMKTQTTFKPFCSEMKCKIELLTTMKVFTYRYFFFKYANILQLLSSGIIYLKQNGWVTKKIFLNGS